MKFILGLIVIFLCYIEIHAQKNDYIWEIGAVGDIPIGDDTLVFAYTKLDFNFDPVKITHDPKKIRKIEVIGSNSLYSSDNGELLAFTNRTYIVNGNYDTMQNGEAIFKDVLWDTFYPIGVSTPQSVLILPWPNQPDSLLVVSTKYSEGLQGGQFTWTGTVDLHNVEGKSEVVEKDRIVKLLRTELGHINAVRHGNGVDWWVYFKELKGEKLYQYLFDKEGMKYIGEQPFTMSPAPTRGQAYFSPDGTKYALIESRVFEGPIHVNLWDYDRCSGMMSNHRRDTIPIHLQDLGAGLSFSPSSEFLYASGDTILYQFATQGDFESSKIEIGRFDGFVNRGFPLFFGYWAHGPDGKLYCASSTGSSYLHIIDYPDEEGLACGFRQHGVKIRNNYQSIPNFPHYRLGPLDNSACDTLGLNNYPVAKFRYEQDTTDHLNIRFTDLSYFRPEEWDWDFDDGTTFEGRKPYWHTFPEPGNYEVCLTVANENGEDSNCRIIHIGDPLSTDEIPSNVDISIYPNPVESDLLITLSEYIPAEGRVELYDMLGQLVKTQTIYYGWNTVNVSTLVSGTYIYRVFDGVKVLGEGKVVKVGG